MLELILPKNKLLKQIFTLWFVLAVIALAFSGIYSFLPYALRTPALSELLDLKHLFTISLMVHVNLGVLVWFLSSTAMLMIIVTKESFSAFSLVAFMCSMFGTVFIIFSPFIGSSEAIKSDYIPILHNLTFILGISLFISGVLLQSILTLLSFKQIKNNLISFTIYLSAIIFLIAVICFIQAAISIKTVYSNRFIDLVEYYQLLFWGPGHVLQFNYIQLIIITWLIITHKLCPLWSPSSKIFYYLQFTNLIFILPCIMVYWVYSLDSPELYEFFTLHMKYVGGILAIIVSTWCSYVIFKENKLSNFNLELTAFLSSIFLILNGGVIGYLITGANVTIPAHYHGVILGITVGLMGLFYIMLEEMGLNKVNQKRAILQIMLYTIGQFIHVMALAISGGYGVLRKTPGTELSIKAKMFMGAMGIGGSIALVGGILFVVLIFKNFRKPKINEQ